MHRLVLLVLALVPSFDHPALAKPAACPDGRFLLPDGVRLLSGSPGSRRQGISLGAGTLELDDGCGPTSAKVKATRRTTRVLARWKTCGDRKRVALKGAIASPACSTLTGRVKARKRPAITFEAVRSTCGDDYADLEAGESCDLATDEPTLDLLDAAHDAIAAGATDVPLSADGTLRFVRTTTATGGIDEIIRGSVALAHWEHDGDTTTSWADQDGDGAHEVAIDAQRAPVRSATIRTDFDDDGVVDRTVSMVQVGADGLQVDVTVTGQSPVGFSAPLVQAARGPRATAGVSVTGENCSTDELASAEDALVDTVIDGFKCLRRLGLGWVTKRIEGKIAKDGIVFRCGASSDCAQVDLLDGFTGGLLPTAIGVNLGASFFTGAGTCGDPAMVLFHELLHVGFGEAHSPTLDRETFEGLATDRVYSCTDICYRPAQATKSECATCLNVDRCDPKCERFADLFTEPPCVGSIKITSATCPSAACSCCDVCPPGAKLTETLVGEANGPEGTYVRVNVSSLLGGQLTCGSWSSAPCPGGDAGLLCCQRQTGEPATTTFVGTLPFALSNCVCPLFPPTEVGSFTAQLVDLNNQAFKEASSAIVCP